MRFKKPIATILAAAMMLSSLPMLAFADEEVEPVPVPVPVRDVCEDESHTSTVMVVASGNASRHEVHCADCDKLKGDGSEDHNREASENSPVSQNASGHTMKCTHCTITWTEPHDTDGVDGECSVCGYDDALAPAVPVGPADCDHDNTHMIVATGNASKHEEYCDTCYSKRSEHYREASDDSPVSQNANGHTMKCDYCDITWTEPHDTDGTDGACSVCGYGADESDPSEPAKPVEPVDPDDCEHKNTQTIVATGNASKHEEYCVKCNSKQSEHDREASDGFVSKNEKGHTVKCKHCDLTWVVSHDTDGADGACSVCGYKPEPVEPKPVEPAVPVDCNHKNTHTIVATGYASKHEEYCNTCNSKLSEHNREVNDEVPVSNGKSGHTVKCRYCSITWSEPHTYRDNGTCLLCGEMHEHVYSNVWEPFTDLHHAKRCTIVGCKYIIAEYHIDSNKDGACDVCGSTNMKNQTGGSSSANTPTIITDPTVTATPAIITAATTTSKFASTPKEIRNSNKSNITVNAAETKVTPAMMTAFTKNKKAKTLTLDYGTKMKVVVSKSDVKDAAKADLDFSVTGKNFISSKSINKNKTLSKAEKVVQMKFVNDGKIKGIEKVTINRRVGKSYAGQKAVVYEYTDGKLVKIATVKVNKNGYVSFKTDHLGKFVIAVY